MFHLLAQSSVLSVDPVAFYSLVFYSVRFCAVHGVLCIITGVIYRI
jgi:hypothetical protein